MELIDVADRPIKVTEWQKTYTYDSGINSGINTSAPSLNGKTVLMDDDDMGYSQQYTTVKTTTYSQQQQQQQAPGMSRMIMGDQNAAPDNYL